MKRPLSSLILAVGVTACSTTSIVTYPPLSSVEAPGKSTKITVFLDGTANDQGSRTNVARLYELITNQDRKKEQIVAFYTEGVGSDGRFIGAGTGWGIGYDVRQAYKFLARHYRRDTDEIYLFGFSRGAFAARILAGFIHSAGLPDLSTPGVVEDTNHLISDLYDAYKGDFSATERDRHYKVVERRWSIRLRQPVAIRFMGLWDTVEALGVPDYAERFIEPNRKYVDQVCNVKEIAHAVALDDNRADSYTPILVKGRHLNELCKKIDVDDRVSEVWFAGAHADVGGGYKEGNLAGVSMNWMLGKLRCHELVPPGARVRENPYDVVHDAEGGNFLYKWLFGRDDRDLSKYAEYGGLTIHKSVIDRLQRINTTVEETRRKRREWNADLKTYDSEWYREEPFAGCFSETGSGYVFSGECRAINVVD